MRAMLVLAVGVLAAGCAEERGPNVTRSIQLAPAGSPGAAFEDNVSMSQGNALRVEFTATDVVDWNLHAHLDEGVRIFDSGRSASASTTAVAPQMAWFGIALWNPHDAPVQVTLTMHYR